jgi:predicted metal-dependent hydrolase
MSMPLPDIRFSPQRRTVRLTVERDRQLVVHAPAGTTPAQIDAILHQKRHWIREKLEHPQKYAALQSEQVLVAGSSIRYLGRIYLLRQAEDMEAGLQFDGQFFILGNQHFSKAAILAQTWLRQHAQEFITPRVERFARSLGVAYHRIQLLDLKYRWGSCTANAALLFNWRLIQAPTTVIDYIIVHELAHLLVPNHSPAFWNTVAVQLPLYERAKSWLREHGNLLEELG